MWISKRKFHEMEKRVEDLEKFKADMTKYVIDEQEINKKIKEELNILPLKITKLLFENGINE